jgi:hypothetical protein
VNGLIRYLYVDDVNLLKENINTIVTHNDDGNHNSHTGQKINWSRS